MIQAWPGDGGGRSAKAQLRELSCIRERALEMVGLSSFQNVFLSRSAQAGLELAKKRHANTLVSKYVPDLVVPVERRNTFLYS